MQEGEVNLRLESIQGGRYEVFEEFAAGGIATVHLARYITPGGINRLVAIKRLHPHHVKDAEFRSALLDEARFGSRVSHPNAVGVIDVIDEGGELVLVMDYVHGVSFSRLIAAKDREPLDPSIACAVVAGVLRGLHAAHEVRGDDGTLLGLVHRDVSPQNILVGADGLARVIDFGLAHALGRASSTKSGEVKGKPSYMSPEQVRGQKLTRASDIFSAGVVLWNALTGRKLFGADSRVEAILMKILTAKIDPPSSVVPNIPPSLDAAVMRALTRAPSSRFSTALAMAQALEAAVPPLPAGELGDWARTTGSKWLDEMSQRVKRIEVASQRPPPLPGSSDRARVGVTHRRSLPDAEEIEDEIVVVSEAPPPSDPDTDQVSGKREVTARLPAGVILTPQAFQVSDPAPPREPPKEPSGPVAVPSETARISISGVTPQATASAVTVQGHERRSVLPVVAAALVVCALAATIAYAAGRTSTIKASVPIPTVASSPIAAAPPIATPAVSASAHEAASVANVPAASSSAAPVNATIASSSPNRTTAPPLAAPTLSGPRRPNPKAGGCVDMLDPRCQ